MDLLNRYEQILHNSTVADGNDGALAEWNTDNWFASEPMMMGLSRQAECNEPDLSMITEIVGEGHVLYSIYQFIMAGTVQEGAVSASAVIKPAFHLQNINTMKRYTKMRFGYGSGHKKAA